MRYATVLISEHVSCRLEEFGLNNFFQKIFCYGKRWMVNLSPAFLIHGILGHHWVRFTSIVLWDITSYTIVNTGLFISPSGISEIDCATAKTDTAERSISIGRESLQVFLY